MLSLENKNILITGASSGIGRACAILASELEATVILVARNEQKLQDTFGSLKPGNHLILSQDIRKYDQLERMIEQSVQQVGKINGFVHSAGKELSCLLQLSDHSLYEDIFSVNVIAGFEIARILSKKQYLSPEGASFIFMSSVMGIRGNRGLTAYCASKASLLGGVRSMATELARKKIRINSLLPGCVQTPMLDSLFSNYPENAINELIKKHPLGLGAPRDVANLVMFLLSDLSAWMTGSEIVIDGGYSIH